MKGRKHITRFTIVMVLAVLAVGVFAGAALAEDNIGEFELTGGELGMSALTLADFADATLLSSGAATTEADSSTYSVTDARGTGAGWEVWMSATQFTAPAVQGVSAERTLTEGIMKLQPFAAGDITVNFGSATKPSIVNATEQAVDNGALQVLDAAASDLAMDGQGMGKYTMPAAHFHVAVPAGAYATTYSSTLTISFTSGP